MGMSLTSSILQNIKRLRERVTIYESLKNTAEEFECDLGYVYASSGYKISSQRQSLDWGLVLVNTERAGWNEVSLIRF